MKRYITTILCLLAFTAAYAGDEATYEKLHTSYTLAADGSQQFRRVMDLKLETHTSFNDLFGETFVVYDPEYQTLTINEAYTTQADGTVVPLPDNAVNESLPHAAADAPAYNRLREAVITHTGLEIGATIHLDYTLSTKAGFYPALEVCETLTEPAASVKDRRIEITVPTGTELRFDPAMKPRRSGDTYTRRGLYAAERRRTPHALRHDIHLDGRRSEPHRPHRARHSQGAGSCPPIQR